jgi:hypothetical protein
MKNSTHMPTIKSARAPKNAKVRFSLVPAVAQQEMYRALTKLKRSKAGSKAGVARSGPRISGAEVAEIAVCLAAGERVPVICACAAKGARLVHKCGAALASADKHGRFRAATLAAVTALLGDANIYAVVVCAGRVNASAKEQADFRNACNFAARHKLPILFVVANSLTPEKPQAVDLRTLYAEFGIPVFSVDANDAIAAYRVATEALHNARHLRGPCVIEALTVRENKDIADPLTLLAGYMEQHGNPPE